MSKSSSEINKQSLEQWWASILLRHFNANGCDYKIKEFVTPREQVDVDVFAVSESECCKPLYLQLTQGYEFLGIEDFGSLKTKILKDDDYNPRDSDTLRRIEEKAAKYTKQGKDFSNLTIVIQKLAIQNDVSYRFGEDVVQKCRNFGFRAIYLVSPSGLDGQRNTIPERAYQVC